MLILVASSQAGALQQRWVRPHHGHAGLCRYFCHSVVGTDGFSSILPTSSPGPCLAGATESRETTIKARSGPSLRRAGGSWRRLEGPAGNKELPRRCPDNVLARLPGAPRARHLQSVPVSQLATKVARDLKLTWNICRKARGARVNSSSL